MFFGICYRLIIVSGTGSDETSAGVDIGKDLLET
jgi:hypothetical protein